jgi:hypothetical protein
MFSICDKNTRVRAAPAVNMTAPDLHLDLGFHFDFRLAIAFALNGGWLSPSDLRNGCRACTCASSGAGSSGTAAGTRSCCRARSHAGSASCRRRPSRSGARARSRQILIQSVRRREDAGEPRRLQTRACQASSGAR